ncbi:CAF17-like 4Fe-4S cluster assembly/insertion protein YgfZ [Teichococcus oryzae]|uniref:Folate-binding protein YgfZ n=1 Tax=Teichococcus oryzae TaxID=1608942 RepID=A0A5B2TJE0_9PROT|nr:folate-binding protein YgfZ [Pseudoroseomonas oryzae]KAA2214299.1 folate-binding protein YgfZ [Pseudoroseomonas oryzae]
MPIALLPARAVLDLSGEDRIAFLQGLVSNDVAQAAPSQAVWAALLTPQGKWLADFFVFADGDRLLLDVATDQAAMLVQRLSRFRLRSRVSLGVAEGLAVWAGWGGTPRPEGVSAADPRLPEAGWRAILPAGATPGGEAGDYNRHRLMLGLPDGVPDMEAEKSVLLEAGFDELGGVSWTKGCYMGQELTARTKYRGLLKKRLFPVAVEGPLPAPGTPILRGEAEVGEMRSGIEGHGLALLRLSVPPGEKLSCGTAVLTASVPDWMQLPEKAG